MKIVLDPNIYLLSESNNCNIYDEFSHLEYFDKIVEFINEFQFAKILCTDLFNEEICTYLQDYPWNQYMNLNAFSLVTIQRKLLRNLEENYHVIVNEDVADSKFNFNYPNRKELCESFFKTISYVHNNHIDILIFFGECHHHISRPVSFICKGEEVNHNPVNNPYLDSHSHLIKLLMSCEKCNKEPSLNELFPNALLSNALAEDFIKKAKRTGSDKIALIEVYSREIALRNGYIENRSLSIKNYRLSKKKSKRLVFESNGREKIYLSADFESGGFEVFNHVPIHLGQFSFTGSKIKPSSAKHKLYL